MPRAATIGIVWLAGLAVLTWWPHPASARDGVYLQRVELGVPLDTRIQQGGIGVWLVRRRAPSPKTHMWIDAVIVVPRGPRTWGITSLRRQDGDHRLLLSRRGGHVPLPSERVREQIKVLRALRLRPYRVARDGEDIATIYLPPGALAMASPRGDDVELSVELPADRARARARPSTKPPLRP